MKQNKKGFTLIELLAVIVILAIIALIATPIIMDVIKDAKKSAAKDSAYGYMKSVENYVAIGSMGNDINTSYTAKVPPSGAYSCEYKTTGSASATNCSDDFLKAVGETVKGTLPDKVSIKFVDGTVSAANLLIDGFAFSIDAQGNATAASEYTELAS